MPRLNRPYDPFLAESERELNALLKRFTYRPRWHFQVNQGFLVVVAEVVDANKPDVKSMITFTLALPYHVYKSFDWTRWLFDQIRNIEMHELQEFFRLDGVPVYDPHPELVGKTDAQV